jgi:purine-binding chemotaxis protein CheW
MANLPATQTECSDTSSELIQLLVSFAQDVEENGTGAQSRSMTSLMLMLNAPPYVEGIINLHGKMIPIISLRK